MLKKIGCFLFVGTMWALVACSSENTVEVSYSAVDANGATEKPSTQPSVPEENTEPVSQKRIGPVSQYGQLMAGKPDGVGRIYGSCEGAVSGKEVQVRGMSLYWSIMKEALVFYTSSAISAMVEKMNIEVIRLAIATEEDWGDGYGGYALDPAFQRQAIKSAVDAAVENDIYVIIDWHSHTAENQVVTAGVFFEEMARTYGQLDNVIFEVYNEPKGKWGISKANEYWTTVKAYADQMISLIRKYSDNLIVVGTPFYSQYPNVSVSNPIADKNVAYSFHYYANSHSVDSEGSNANAAMSAGYSVFVSEWGAGDADGGGTPGVSANASWQKWLDKNKLSWANWSASRINEGTAAFAPASTSSDLIFTESGSMVKGFLSSNPETYSKCASK